jgi:hypothetical protein
MLSTVLARASTRGVVIGIENRTQNVNNSRNECLLPFQDLPKYGRRIHVLCHDCSAVSLIDSDTIDLTSMANGLTLLPSAHRQL